MMLNFYMTNFFFETNSGTSNMFVKTSTLQGPNIPHPGKRNIIDSKLPTGRGYVRSQEGTVIISKQKNIGNLSGPPPNAIPRKK